MILTKPIIFDDNQSYANDEDGDYDDDDHDNDDNDDDYGVGGDGYDE